MRRAQSGSVQLLTNWVNVGEVASIVERSWGQNRVLQMLATLEATDVQIVVVERSLALTAAHIKTSHYLAYADAFAAALALNFEVTLVTGDPEFKDLVGALEIMWLAPDTLGFFAGACLPMLR
jgi:ribonuclease VapC